jgi:DNA polymerase III epsilon subunit-like protein
MAHKTLPIFFIDLETTGHDPLKRVGDHLIRWHEIIDIGGVIVDQRTLLILDVFEAKIAPEHPERCLPHLVNDYPAREIRGEWDNACSLKVAINSLFKFIKRFGTICIPGGQNWFFDWNFLSIAFAWCGISEEEWIKYLHYTRFDTRSMAIQELLTDNKVYDPDEFSIRTGRLLVRLGIEPEPEVHEAINGAMKSFEVYKKLRELRLLR